jgi:hypothetical protein
MPRFSWFGHQSRFDAPLPVVVLPDLPVTGLLLSSLIMLTPFFEIVYVVPLLIGENILKQKRRGLISLACGPGDDLFLQSAPTSPDRGEIPERFFTASEPFSSPASSEKSAAHGRVSARTGMVIRSGCPHP